MIFFLLVVFSGTAEIARACWWLKNQLNNAARVAVRVAIATLNLASISSSTCASASDVVVVAACNSITNTSLHDGPNTKISLTTTDENAGGTVDPGDTVTVTVQGTFRSAVPDLASLSLGLFQGAISMQTSALMRYE